MKAKLLIIIKTMKKLKLAHPGKLLFEEFIRPMNVTLHDKLGEKYRDNFGESHSSARIRAALPSILPIRAVRKRCKRRLEGVGRSFCFELELPTSTAYASLKCRLAI